MASLASIRSKLQGKIFDSFGSTATRSPYVSETRDKWGDETVTYGTDTTITVIPFDYITNRLDYQPFGNLQENEVAMIVSYDTTLNAEDKITYDSTTYKVVEIEKFMFDDGAIAKAVRLTKIL